MTEPQVAAGDSRRWAFVGALTLLAIAVWRWIAFPGPSGGDWAQYMSHAKALVEGRPYGDIGYLFSPYAWTIGPPVYPPGLPLLLAPSLALIGEALWLPRLMMHGFLAVLLVSVVGALSGKGRTPAAIGAAIMVGAVFLLRDAPNVIGSDLGMCALVWAVLVLAKPQTWGWGRALTIGFLGAFALNFRIAAAPLVPALALWAVLHRKDVDWKPWLVIALWATTLYVVITQFGPGEQAVESAAANLAADGPVRSQWARQFDRLLGRLAAYRYAVSDAFLYPFPVAVANRVYHVVAAPLALVGLVRWARGRWSSLPVIFAAGTTAMLLILPVWVSRYAWVLIPLGSFGFLYGLDAIRVRLRPNALRTVLPAVALGVTVLAAVSTAARGTPSLVHEPEAWRAVGARLAGGSGGPDVRVASNRPRIFTWYTGIPAAGLANVQLETFRAEASRLGLTHVVLSESRTGERVMNRWRRWNRDHPDAFPLLFREGDLSVYSIPSPTP